MDFLCTFYPDCRLEAEEKARKSDVAAVKLRYDKRATALADELKSIQGQVLRFKRERDTFKHMLEGAQKTIADLKISQNSQTTRSSISSTSEDVCLLTNIRSADII